MTAWSNTGALLVMLGGALGSLARYGAGVALARDDFPWATAAVNVLGSFLIGLVMFSNLAKGTLGPEARLFLVTGVLGGFTTMSAFAYESAAFLTLSDWGRAGAHLAFNIGGSLAAALLGRLAAEALA